MCSLIHILLKRLCIFLKSHVLCNRLWNIDSKQSEIHEAIVKVILTVKKKKVIVYISWNLFFNYFLYFTIGVWWPRTKLFFLGQAWKSSQLQYLRNTCIFTFLGTKMSYSLKIQIVTFTHFLMHVIRYNFRKTWWADLED